MLSTFKFKQPQYTHMEKIIKENISRTGSSRLSYHYTLRYKIFITYHYVQERAGINHITYKHEEQQDIPPIMLINQM